MDEFKPNDMNNNQPENQQPQADPNQQFQPNQQPYGNQFQQNPQDGQFQQNPYTQPQYQQPQYDQQQSYYEYVPPAPESTGQAVAAMVLGIVASVLFCCAPFNIIPSIIALILGIVYKKKNKSTGNGMALAGIIMGAIGIVYAIISTVFSIITIQQMGGWDAYMEQVQEIMNQMGYLFML